jgi:hypothetical protein
LLGTVFCFWGIEQNEKKDGMKVQSFFVAPAGIVNLLQQVDLQLKTEAKKIKLT